MVSSCQVLRIMVQSRRLCLFASPRQSSFADLISSTPTPTPAAEYNRPNRLKGREENSIRWTDLFEKFRAVQEKARRAQRPGAEFEDAGGLSDRHAGEEVNSLKDLRLQTPAVPAKEIAHPPPPAQPAKSKTGLGKFGRFGGGTAGRAKR